MKCKEMKGRFADYLLDQSGEASKSEISLHLAGCPDCRAEAEGLSLLWEKLGSLPKSEPSERMRANFYTMLDAYQEGLDRATARESSPLRGNWWDFFLRPVPALQFVLAALLMLGGILIGRWIPFDTAGSGEVSQLRSEMSDMRQIVALSLLQQQSASERLSGLSWSQQVERPNQKILEALVRALSDDPDVNVRLAAVDALYRFSDRSDVKESLIELLPAQTSPLVQIALIDLLAELSEKKSLKVLRHMAGDERVDPNVRGRAEWAMARISRQSL